MILTNKAKIDFEIWFNKNYKHNFLYYQSKPMKKVLNIIIVDWFNSLESGDIGGSSISDIIHVEIRFENIFEAIEIAIKELNKNYNQIQGK